MDFDHRFKARQSDFMFSFDPKEQLCRRENYAVELRRTKRDEISQQRRGFITNQARADVIQLDQSGIPMMDKELAQALAFMDSNLPLGSKFGVLKQVLREHRLNETTLQTLRFLRRLTGPKSHLHTQELSDPEVISEVLWYVTDLHGTPIVSEAVWLLANIASLNHRATEAILNLMNEKVIGALLRHEDVGVNECALYLVANIAGDCIPFCQRLISTHCHYEVISLLKKKKNEKSLVKRGSWALSNLVRHLTDVQTVRAVAEMLALLVNSEYSQVRLNVLRSMDSISGMQELHIKQLFDLDLLSPVLKRFQASSPVAKAASLRVFVNITGDSIRVAQSLLDLHLLDTIHSALNHEDNAIRTQVMHVLSNVAAGSGEQITYLINHPIFREAILKIADASLFVRNETARLLANVAYLGSRDHMVTLVSFGVFPLVKVGLQDIDPKVVMVIDTQNSIRVAKKLLNIDQVSGLSTFENMFNETGCLEALEQLQDHENGAVAEESHQIISKFFGGGQQQEGCTTAEISSGFVFS